MDEKNEIQRYEPASKSLERRGSFPPRFYGRGEMEKPPDLLAYWRMLRKRRWTIFSVFFVLFSVVLIGTFKQTRIYRAKALIEIEKEHPNIVTAQELFKLETVSDTYLKTQYTILETDSLARRVIEQLGLDKLEEFGSGTSSKGERAGEKTSASPETFSENGAGAGRTLKTYPTTLANFRRRLTIKPVTRSRLVEVSFESQDPKLAAQVVNTLAASYIEQSLEARWEATQKASEWLSQQLEGLKVRLEKSEDGLQRYARENGLLFLETEKGNMENIVNERFRQLQEELTKAQAARYQKESLYRLIEAGDYESLPGMSENKLMHELTVQLAELRGEHVQLATTFRPDYPKVKQIQNRIDEIETVLAQERQRAAQGMINDITSDYRAAVQRETFLRQALEDQQEQANLIAERSVQYNILKREVETNKELYEGLLQRLKEAGISGGLKASNIRIVDPAVPPMKPARPKVFLNLAIAVILGVGLGMGAAFLEEHLDNTLKTSEDVERFLHVPALAFIPSVEGLNGRRGGVYGLYGRRKLLSSGTRDSSASKLQTSRAPLTRWYRIDEEGHHHSVLAEAFRSLRTSVLLSTAEHPPRSLLVTSAQPGEGKTTISLNLAISLAQLGQRVLLIDGDMRRPCLHKAFGIKGSSGLVSHLTGQQDWQATVHPTSVSGLSTVVCGPVPPNPAELLSSDRMRALIRDAMAEYNFVVIDSPPLLNVSDSRILITYVEGVVLVVKGGTTPRELVQRAQSYARDVGGNIIGAVLNNQDVRADDYYYYRYYRYDYYGKDSQEEEESSENS